MKPLFVGARSSGKSKLMAKWRDALLKAGKTVHVASYDGRNVNVCEIKPFRRKCAS